MNYMQFIDKLGAETKPKIIFEKLKEAGITKNTAGRALKMKDIYDYRARVGQATPRDLGRPIHPMRGRPRGSYKKRAIEAPITLTVPSQKAFLIYADVETIKQIIGAN